VETLKSDLEELLATQGLFQKEAEAMLRTWEDSWFEEGFRVFFVLPRTQTNAILPLEVTPRPRRLVRVLAGRIEVMTQEAVQDIFGFLSLLKTEPRINNAEVSVARQRYGRFLAPMIRSVLDSHPALWDPGIEGSLVSLGLPAPLQTRPR